jgi:hypothetical protein
MVSKEQTDDDNVEKIGALNEIFEDVISDASDLIKDLYWGVKTYMFFGLISILFGVSEILYTSFYCGSTDIFWVCSNYQLL